MAILRLADEHRTIEDFESVRSYLETFGLDHERWIPAHDVSSDAPDAAILEAYFEEVEALKQRGGYVTADVINVSPKTPGLDEMLAQFKSEHWHDEDEVRFIIAGRGVFHVRGQAGNVVEIEVAPGDLIRLPQGTNHWFNLCADRQIRAIRLFKDPAGWAARYTGSGADAMYQPLCLGASYIPFRAVPGA
ncbi:MAG TPA: cupin domain-containing protein [Blastocatellia bacterium]|nr:cupin domain-containing protein [Blastocatellia bacterium]